MTASLRGSSEGGEWGCSLGVDRRGEHGISFEKLADGRDCGKEGLEEVATSGFTVGEADRPGTVGLLNFEKIRESELRRDGDGGGRRLSGKVGWKRGISGGKKESSDGCPTMRGGGEGKCRGRGKRALGEGRG